MASKEATPAEVKDMIAQNAAVAYLDVRTPEEFANGHVTDAKNIPIMVSGAGGMSKNEGFMEAVTAAYTDKDAPIVVGCKAGGRSLKAIAEMQGAGYTNLTNVTGGYDGWVAAGL